MSINLWKLDLRFPLQCLLSIFEVPYMIQFELASFEKKLFIGLFRRRTSRKALSNILAVLMGVHSSLSNS